MRFTIIAALLVISICSFGQRKTKALKAIYSTIVDYSYRGVPNNIVVNDSAHNDYILKIDYWDMAVNLNNIRKAKQVAYPALDPSWIPFLKLANIKKEALQPVKIARFTVPGLNIVPASMGLMHVNSRLTLSGIILSKDKAIVELNRSDDVLDGEGNIYFLQKIKKKWIVVSVLSTWIS